MNQSEFEARIHEQRPQLLRLAHRMLPPADCEDAVQNAILSAWEHLPQLRNESAFDSWLRQILVNQCHQTLRRIKRERDLTEKAAAQSEAAPESIGLDEALDRLDAEDKRLLLLHHEKGYSIGELSRMTGKPEDALKMRMYRARRRLRVALISILLLLFLLAAAAIGTGYLDVNWFLQNRRASQPELYAADSQSASTISYDGLLLSTEVTDAIWDKETLSLLVTYSLAGTDAQALTVHSGNLGVDGVRHDHIWVDGDILPVEEWAQGKPVYTYTLTDGWHNGTFYPKGSEDYLVDGRGETFFSELYLDLLKPELYEQLLGEDDTFTLSNQVLIRSYGTGEILEEGTLTLCIAAPSTEEWRNAYEAYYR